MSQNLIKPRAHFHLQETQGIAEQAKRQEEANGPEGRTGYSTTSLPSLTSQRERTFERASRYIMTKCNVLGFFGLDFNEPTIKHVLR